jgi:hypothetical protein
VNAGLFVRAAALQTLLVGVLFAVLAITVPHSFFDDWGALVGPLAWIGCALGTGRLLAIPLGRLALAAAAGGAAAGLIGAALEHFVSLPVAVLVFGAVCAARGPREAASAGRAG